MAGIVPVMVTPSAFASEWATGDRALARAMAREYVQSRRADLDLMVSRAVRVMRAESPVTREELVQLVDRYRELGDDESCAVVDMLLLVDYEPQAITGQVHLSGAAGDAMAAAVAAAESIIGGGR